MAYATERARLMFGCYRRGDANEPDVYVAAIASVLSRYEMDVIHEVTDPFSGLPGRKKENGFSGLPDVADVKEACELSASRKARISELGAARFKPNLRIARDPYPGQRANLLVRRESPQYARMVEKSKTKEASALDWKMDDAGIWVRYDWLPTMKQAGPN